MQRTPASEAFVVLTYIDGLSPHPLGRSIGSVLSEEASVQRHVLAEERFAPCLGCFECWVAHPGTCKARDSANDLMRDLIAADEAVWAVRPRFGSWDASTKSALDKTIGLISPFFSSISGETHHQPRYARYPRKGVVAVVDRWTPPGDIERFRLLVARNAVNFQSEAPWVAFVAPDADPDTLRTEIHAARAAAQGGFPALTPFSPRTDAVGVPARPGGAPRRVTLLVGSAKPAGESASELLGRALVDRLVARGWQGHTAYLSRLVRLRGSPSAALVDAFRDTDLVVLATPVYVDTVPALVQAALEQLDAVDIGPRRPALLPVVQCGFPELTHTALALAVLSAAANQLGLPWAGHLALGGGGAFHQATLDARDRMHHHQVAGLDEAAAALDAGAPVPASAIDAFAVPVLGPGLYRFMGNLGWLTQAWRNGRLRALGDRPFADRADGP